MLSVKMFVFRMDYGIEGYKADGKVGFTSDYTVLYEGIGRDLTIAAYVGMDF